MDNTFYILAPKDVKITIHSKKLCLDGKPTEIGIKVGGNERIKFMRKSSEPYFDIYYIENCKVEDKKVVPVKKEECAVPSVLVCSKTNITTREHKHNYYHLDKTGNIDCCLITPTGNDVNFCIDRPLVFDVSIAKIFVLAQ